MLLTHTWVIFQRQMRMFLRNPVWLIFGLSQPILYLGLFGPLLKNVSGGGLGGENSWKIFVPGLLLQLVIFGAGFAGFGIIQELREGVVDRQRVTPASRLSLLLGRTFANTVTLLVQAALLTLVAIPFGLRGNVFGIILSVILVSVLALGMSAASFSLGLILKNEDSFAPVIQGVTLPLMLLSGVFLPLSLAPGWLRHLSDVNPMKWLVEGSRDLFNGHFTTHNVALGSILTIVMTVLLAWWGARMFQKSSA